METGKRISIGAERWSPASARPGETWQEAAGSAELFLAAAGALGSRREERLPHRRGAIFRNWQVFC